MPTAMDRPGYTGGGTEGLAAYYTQQKRLNPAFRAPEGYKWHGDHYERDTRDVWDRVGQVAAGAGIGAMGIGGLGLAGIGPAAAGAGAGGAGGAAGAVGPTIASGVPEGLPGAMAGFGGLPPIASGVPAGLPGAVSLPSFGGTAGGSVANGGILSTLRNIFGLAGDVGGVLGTAAKGAAEGRHVDALLSNQRDALRTDQFKTAQDAQFGAGALDLNRKQFEETSRGGRARQATIGNLLSNLQDIAINVPGVENSSITGGLRPSALGPGGRAAGSELAKQAMLKLLAPEEYSGGELLTPPQMTPIPEVSNWEKLAGIGGVLGPLAGAIGQAGRPRAALTSTVAARG